MSDQDSPNTIIFISDNEVQNLQSEAVLLFQTH
jgi:hypothetical protein